MSARRAVALSALVLLIAVAAVPIIILAIPAGATSTSSLSVSNVAQTGATLTIADHTGDWYYKASAGPHTSCSSAQSGTTATLTGLTAGSLYAYTAYSASGCATANALDTIRFLTVATGNAVPALTVANISENGAALTIADHTAQWWYEGTVVACQSVVAATATVNLTGLSPAARYIYGAYRDDKCANRLAIPIGFKTLKGSLTECHNLTLEMYLDDSDGNDSDDLNYRVGNRGNRAISNVNIKIKSESPQNDGSASSSDYQPYTDDDGVTYENSALEFIYLNSDGNGSVSHYKPKANYRNSWYGSWVMPTILPSASHSINTSISGSSGDTRVRRNTVAMEQLSASGTALCRTERVYWARTFGKTRIWILDTKYGVALSVDERRPAKGDTVNFKVRVNSHRGHNVHASVEHTEGLELPTTPTAPAKTAWTYDATNRKGDFDIGTEDVLGSNPKIYEITLPMRVKDEDGVVVGEQCVTATVTGVPGVGPRVLGHTGDDPSDNTAKLCLGSPPLYHEDGDELALWTVYPCVSNTTSNTRSSTAHPCDSTDTLEIASVNNATGEIVSAAPDVVNAVIKLDPVDAAVVDTAWSGVHVYRDPAVQWNQNSDKVSWQTKRSCTTRHHGHENCGSNR